MIEQVLPSCRRVAESAQLVTIDEAALAAFAGPIANLLPRRKRHTPHHFIADYPATSAYFLILDALNFGSGIFAHYAPYRGEDGYYALASALRDWFNEQGTPPSCDALQVIDAVTVARILGQDADNEALVPFIGWAVEALRELGRFVETELGGVYANLLAVAKLDAAAMVDLLT